MLLMQKVSTTYRMINTISSIGIGSSGNNKNAVEVLTNGEVYITGIGNYIGITTTGVSSVQGMISYLSDQIIT